MNGIEGSDILASERTEIRADIRASEITEIRAEFEKKIEDLGPYPKEGCIFKVPVNLRSTNGSVYLPRIVSIGPLHHHDGEEDLLAMEIYKEQYLKQYLEFTGMEVGEMLQSLKNKEESVRKAYYENQFPPNFGRDRAGRKNFISMMLLDGCFIVWLFFLFSNFAHAENVDRIMFGTEYLQRTIYYDLLLVENQLPFFLLEHIFGFIRKKEVDKLIRTGEQKVPCTFKELTLHYFTAHDTVEVLHLTSNEVEVKHLVDFLLHCYMPLQEAENEARLDMPSETGLPEIPPRLENSNLHLLSAIELKNLNAQCEDGNFHLPSATELNKLGVQFKKAELDKLGQLRTTSLFKRGSFLDVTFEKGVLEMPLLFVDQSTERIFRNFVAMEECQGATSYITDYLTLMDYLVNTSSDVTLLKDCGIIYSYLGSDEEVCRIFNSMLSGVFRRKAKKSYYNKIIQDLDDYSQKSWNQWKANVKRDYFSTPMTVVSLIAAFVFLAGTVMQTVYAVIAFYQDHKGFLI